MPTSDHEQRQPDRRENEADVLSARILTTIRDLHGHAGVNALLKEMAERMAGLHAEQVQGATITERIELVVEILNELGYVAVAETGSETPAITAVNCVYHHLAAEFSEVCQLDVDLIQRLTGSHVEQTDCMLRGGECCRFEISTPRP